MSDKAGKESQYMVLPLELSSGPPIGSNRESGRDREGWFNDILCKCNILIQLKIFLFYCCVIKYSYLEFQ